MAIWGARVLFVGDGEEMLEVAARVLQARGADVIVVPTTGAALATVIGVVPDVLVVDLTLTGNDGLGFVRTVRSLSPEKGGQVPAIALGAVCLDAGLQGHLVKPFEPADLAALVERLAGRAVERRRRALDRRYWPRDVSHDRRAEVRMEELEA